MRKRVFGRKVERARAWEERAAREARNSAREADCIRPSREIVAYIYLSVKTNRKYKKKKRIGELRDDGGKSEAEISEERQERNNITQRTRRYGGGE